MNKTQLKEIIHSVVAHKLAEARGQTTGKYGYILANKGTDDPRLQLVGYGNMPKSYWKKKILQDIENLKQQVETDSWSNAAHLIERNSVLHSSINMMKEIFDNDLEEAVDAAVAAEQTDSETETDVAKIDPKLQRDITETQKVLDRITNEIRKIDGAMSKLQEGIRRKVQDLERKKASYQKKQGDLTKKLERLKQDAGQI